MKEQLYKILTEGPAKTELDPETLRLRLDGWDTKRDCYIQLVGETGAFRLSINLGKPIGLEFVFVTWFNLHNVKGLESLAIAANELLDCIQVAMEVRNLLKVAWEVRNLVDKY
jgi:hypothetical protein